MRQIRNADAIRLTIALIMISVGLAMLSRVVTAQSFTGSVSGVVLDPQAAVIPDVKLTLKNAGTGAERVTISDAEGNYQFAVVPPGKYTLSAEAPGFSITSLQIEVTVATSVRADVTLNVGGVKETLDISEVVGTPEIHIPTDRPEVSNTVTTRQLLDLPTLTRNPYELVMLSPGAALTSDNRGIGLAVNGQRASSGNYILDGGENNDPFVAGVAQSVPVDSIKEFRVLTSNYLAEYGRSAGFIANVVTKSGSNQFHGSLYEFNRNSALAANSFNNNANGVERPVFNRNQFGGSVGGPVIRDKAFFFGSIEPIIVRSIASSFFRVPTPELLSISSPGSRAIFDRFPVPTTGLAPGVLSLVVCPFQGDCNPETGEGFVFIPAYADIFRTGPRDAGAGSPQNTYLATGRVDYTINTKMQVFGRYAISDQDVFPVVNQPYSAELDQPFARRAQNILINLTRTWSTKLITETRAVYSRMREGTPPTPDRSFPLFAGSTLFGTLPSGFDGSRGAQNLYQFYQTANLIKGRHLVKFGGQFEQIRDNRFGVGLLQRPDARFANTQQFINGILSSFTFSVDPRGHMPGEVVDPPYAAPSVVRHFRYNEFVLFAQDTWKATTRLTLSLGLRWEYFGVLHSPGHEKALDSNFYYGEGSNTFERIANGRFLRTVDAPGNLRGRFYSPDYKNFAPRLGIAYDIFGDGKTVFRSGVGIFYDRNFGNALSNVSQNPPGYANLSFGNVRITPELLTNPYAFLGNNSLRLLFISGRHLDEHLKTAYTVAWNAGIERQIKNAVIIGATYTGSSGNRLYSLTNINRVGSGTLIGQKASAENPLNTLVAGAFNINTRSNLGHSSYNSLQLRAESGYIKRLGLQFTANYTWSHSIDNASSFFYDDVVANPLAFGFLDSFNPDLDRGDSDFDSRHRFVTSFVWDIPSAGKKERWTSKYLLGGWTLSGVLSFQTGQPFSIFDSGNLDFFGNESPRPLYSGAAPQTTLVPDAFFPNTFLYLPLNPIRDQSFNCISGAAPFACSASVNGPFDGSISRNVFRRPGTQFHNLAIMKTFALPTIGGREGMKLQLRGEFYNVFNHSNLYVDAGTNNITFNTFNRSDGSSTPGVTVRRGNFIGFSSIGGRDQSSFIDNRQVVLALKFIF